MPERSPASRPTPSRPNPPWGKRLVAGAALLGALGAAYKHRSGAHDQGQASSHSPDPHHDDYGQDSEAVAALSGQRDAQSARDQLRQGYFASQDGGGVSDVYEYRSYSSEEAERIGLEVYLELASDGGLDQYDGRYAEFKDEISMRLAARFGRSYSPRQEPFLSARRAIDGRMLQDAQSLMDEAYANLQDPQHAIQAGAALSEAVRTATLLNPASGVSVALFVEDGVLAVNSLRQHRSAEADGPSPWNVLIPSEDPQRATDGLRLAWPHLNEEEREFARNHVHELTELVRSQIDDARGEQPTASQRAQIASLSASLAQWETLLRRL